MSYFHFTKPENVEHILREGLLPGRGDNSNLVEEKLENVLFLSSKKSMPFWRILLDPGAMLEISDKAFSTVKAETFEYDGYTETIVHGAIKPEFIRVAKYPAVDPNAMHRLALSCFYTITDACVMAARFYDLRDSGPSAEELEDMRDEYTQYLISALACGEKINFAAATSDEYIKILDELAESGEFTMCDRFGNTDCTLWEMLTKYDEPIQQCREKALRDLIAMSFADKVLYTDTGGWTPSLSTLPCAAVQVSQMNLK